MGHKVRAEVQDKRINEIFDWVKDGRTSERMLVMLDFKMTVEPELHLETQPQYYGKAGMSWHGAAIFYTPDKGTDLYYLEIMKKFSRIYKQRASGGCSDETDERVADEMRRRKRYRYFLWIAS